MFMKEEPSGHLVEILSLQDLFDPFRQDVAGRYHFGEEAQEPETIPKAHLVFLSGESLPQCWLDPHYRDHELPTKG